MRDSDLVAQYGLIASDDKEVVLDAKVNVSIFDYMNYLVNCMTSISDNSHSIKNRHRYILACFDDTTGVFGGPYFKVTKVANNI